MRAFIRLVLVPCVGLMVGPAAVSAATPFDGPTLRHADVPLETPAARRLDVTLEAPAARRADVPSEDPAVRRAADALVLGQRDFDAAAASWSWHRGGDRPAPNTTGVIALGLVHAAATDGDGRTLSAARAWGDARLDDLFAWRDVFDPDVEALAALHALTGDARYRDGAREAFARRWSGAEGEEVVGRLLMVRHRRPELVGYDAALTIRAAVAVGELDFAAEIADALLAARDAWDRAPSLPEVDVVGLSTTGRASVLGALAALDDARSARGLGPRYGRVVDGLMVWLVAAQSPAGEWAQRNTQATAYAVRALAAVDSPMAREAAARGARWLGTTQLSDGHWASFNDGLPEPFVGDVVNEITAEVALALTAVR